MSMSGILGNEQNKSNGIFLRTLKFRQRVKRKNNTSVAVE